MTGHIKYGIASLLILFKQSSTAIFSRCFHKKMKDIIIKHGTESGDNTLNGIPRLLKCAPTTPKASRTFKIAIPELYFILFIKHPRID